MFSAPPSIQEAELQEILKNLFIDFSKINWVVLVNNSGVTIGSSKVLFPFEKEERIHAMSAGISGVGGRATHEIASGDFQYMVIAGVKSKTIVIQLDYFNILTIGLPVNISLDYLLELVQKEIVPPLLEIIIQRSVK